MLDKQSLDDLLYIVRDAQARLHDVQCAVEQCLALSLLNDLEHVANTLGSVEEDLEKLKERPNT